MPEESGGMGGDPRTDRNRPYTHCMITNRRTEKLDESDPCRKMRTTLNYTIRCECL
jgi:hypothetical protein